MKKDDSPTHHHTYRIGIFHIKIVDTILYRYYSVFRMFIVGEIADGNS